jgi:hypothetical protein
MPEPRLREPSAYRRTGSAGSPLRTAAVIRFSIAASGSAARTRACSQAGCIHSSHPVRSMIVCAWP